MADEKLTRRRMRLQAAEIESIFSEVHALHPCPTPDCNRLRLRMHRVLVGELPPSRWERFITWITG